MDSEDAAQLRLGTDFDESASEVSSLWNAEVAFLLEGASGPMVDKTLRYVQRFSNYTSAEAIRQAKEAFRAKPEHEHLSPYEVACLNNLNVMSVDEALSLVPSLRTLQDRIKTSLQLTSQEAAKIDTEQIIRNVLDDLKRFQNA